MTEFVVFTLAAPMGSFGDLAGHERRGSDEWPSRSAILGLVGAALGVRREDRQGQQELSRWRVAVSTLSIGGRLRDFHTVQAVPNAALRALRIKRPATRREALEALRPKDNPLVTRRDYRTDCAFGVALWGSGDLQQLPEALMRPVFVPYLGRKSCPLSAPMAPRIVVADSPVEALGHVQLPPYLESRLDPERPLLVASDEPVAGGREQIRWDEPLDRERVEQTAQVIEASGFRASWHFGQRTVHLTRPHELPADE